MRNSSKISGKQTIPLLLLLAISFSALPAQAKYGGGSGTPEDPYLIYTPEQMNEIGLNENEGDWDKHFMLMADINLGGYTGTSFNIIGNDTTPFTGGFDGTGNTLSNFTYGPTNSNKVGLFGTVRGGDTLIENLGLAEVRINTTGHQTGAIVAQLGNGATLANCSVRNGLINASNDAGGIVGTNDSGTIQGCEFEGIIDASSTVGGLVGYNTFGGTILNCYSKGTVIGFAAVGGLVGENSFDSLISMCYSLCDVQRASAYHMYFGGLVGANSQGTITNSYAQGSVIGGSNTGGLTGNNSKIIRNCYAVGSVSGTTNVGGLVGSNDDMVEHSFWDIETCLPATGSAAGTPKTTFQMQMESTFTYAGWDFATPLWKICEGADYPRLSWEQCWIQQGIIEKWVAFYHNHEQLSIIDVAKDIAVDDLGNVYVTGESYNSVNKYDYATIKYAPDGDELWVARYNGPANKGDRVVALAVDNAGNTCVTGRSSGDGTGADYATVKYDPNGSELWVVRYNNQENLPDDVEDIAVDDLGNVYVTGKSYTDLGGADFCTIKYDANSVELWVATYNGLMHYSDGAEALALDDSGNVYVTGSSSGYGTGDDYATVKYDSNGVEQWVARYNGPADDHDYAYAIDLDDSGNVYITGRSIGNGSGPDTATVKYDVNGTELWVARYNGPGNDYDEALSIVTDDSGNVYVGGSSEGVGTSRDYIIIKYDPNGTELWVARYNGPEDLDDIAAEIALDNAGNVYITGASNFSMFTMPPCDATTIKYDTNGNELWNIEYSTSEFSPDLAYGIAVDSSRNVYIAGSSNNGSAYLTARYAHCSYPGDLDNDFDVDFGDYAILTMRWLDEDCGQCGRADLTGNEDVGFDDLKKYADNWLAGF